MKTKIFAGSLLMATCTLLSCQPSQETSLTNTEEIQTVGNPYLPMWEHIPDGEPYVFEDPDNPDKLRAYIR